MISSNASRPTLAYANNDDSPSEGDDEALLEYAKRCWKKAQKSKIGMWREDAREDYDFVAGEQWDQADKMALADQLRPVITFNRIGTTIDSVTGYEVNNRQEVRFYPRQLGDSPVNELLTGAAKWIRDECDAEDEESDAFWDMIVCGMGWTDTHMSYDEDPEGMAQIDRCDPLEMFWDPGASKRNLSDARFVGRVRKMARSDVEAMAGKGVDIEGDDAPWKSWRDEDDTEPHNQTIAKFYPGNNPNAGKDDTDELIVLQLQWSEQSCVYKVLDPVQQKITMMPEEQFKAVEKQARKFGVQLRSQKLPKKVCRQAFFCGETVLESGDCPDPMRFSLRCMTGKRDRNSGTWYGLVRAMKDPQRWANKWLSQLLHIMNSNSKGGIIAEAGAFEDQKQAEETWADPSGITWAANGAIAQGRIKDKAQTQFSAGHMQLTEFAATSIRDVTGINIETLGLADRNQPGILEAHRKQAGMTILAPMFDSLRRYRKEQGRVLLYLIQHVMSDGRLIRIEGPEMAQYVPLLRDEGVSTYDVIVDDAPTSPNQKEQVFSILMQIMPGLMKAGIPIPPELLEYTPLPNSLVQKWKQTIKQREQQPQQDPKMLMMQAKVAGDQQKLQLDAQHQQMKAQADAADDGRRAQLEQQQFAQELEHDRQKAALTMQLQREKMMADINEAHMRAQADIEIARQKAEAQTRFAERKAAVQEAQMTMPGVE